MRYDHKKFLFATSSGNVSVTRQETVELISWFRFDSVITILMYFIHKLLFPHERVPPSVKSNTSGRYCLWTVFSNQGNSTDSKYTNLSS